MNIMAGAVGDRYFQPDVLDNNIGQGMENVYNEVQNQGANLSQIRQQVFTGVDTNDTQAMRAAMDSYRQALESASQQIRSITGGRHNSATAAINQELQNCINKV